jgi:hypothetical protein
MAPPLSPLTPEQVGRFVRDGYLKLEPAAAVDPPLLERCVDAVWRDATAGFGRLEGRLQRGQPASWRGPFSAAEIALGQEDTRSAAERGGGMLPMLPMSAFHMGLREIGAREDFLRLLPQRIWPWAEQLVGDDKLVWPSGDLPRKMIPVDYRGAPRGEAQPPERKQYEGIANRGVYCTFPGGQARAVASEPADKGSTAWHSWWQTLTAPRCHDDGYWGSSIRLGAVLLLEDVPPCGGAFGVWPGSHARLYGVCSAAEPGNGKKSALHTATIDAIRQDTLADDLHGPAGTVILWHPRLAHMAGPNCRDNIRMALLFDFHAKGGDEPQPDDMWAWWSDEVREAAAAKSKM